MPLYNLKGLCLLTIIQNNIIKHVEGWPGSLYVVHLLCQSRGFFEDLEW